MHFFHIYSCLEQNVDSYSVIVYWKRPSFPVISGIVMLLISSSTNFWVSNFTENTQKTVSRANNWYIWTGLMLQPEIKMSVNAGRLDSCCLIIINQNQNALHPMPWSTRLQQLWLLEINLICVKRKCHPVYFLIIMSNFMSKVVSFTHI